MMTVLNGNKNIYISLKNNFFQFKKNWIWKFSNNVDLRKQDFLSAEKISERCQFVNKELIQ